MLQVRTWQGLAESGGCDLNASGWIIRVRGFTTLDSCERPLKTLDANHGSVHLVGGIEPLTRQMVGEILGDCNGLDTNAIHERRDRPKTPDDDPPLRRPRNAGFIAWPRF
jgi:hypothetical protein